MGYLWLISIDAIDIVKCSLEYMKWYYQEILQSTRKESTSELMKNIEKIMVFPLKFRPLGGSQL